MRKIQKILLIFPVLLACSLFSSPRSDLVFSPDTLPEAQIGIPYEVEIQISENATPVGDFYLVEGSLPKGLILEFIQSEDKAKIHGTPEEAGAFKFKVGVWCFGTSVNGQTGEREYTIVVK